MKRLIYTFLFIQMVLSVFAQTPQAVCYQAVAADAGGASLVEQNITVRTTIISTTPNGTAQWIETHNVTTDEFGLFTLNVGEGTPAGGVLSQFEQINWGNGTYFLKVELDIAGGNNFSFMGTNQILSVPYALYAEASNTANTANTAAVADTALIAQIAITTLGDDDGDPTNELQTLEYQDNILSLSGSNGTPINLDVRDEDADPTNEIQTLEYQDNLLSLSGSDSPPISLDVRDEDADPTNEIQTLEYQNNLLSLSGSEGTPISLDVRDEDADPLNEIQALEYQNNLLSLSGSDSPPISLDVRDEDADPTNEIQNLTFENNILTISGSTGNGVNFGDFPFGGAGASIDFPQGIVGEHLINTMGQYQVPTGKVFYITAGGPSIKLLGFGPNNVNEHPNTPNMPILPSGTTINDCMCTGLLVDEVPGLEAIIVDLTTNDFTVPNNMVFFLKSGLTNSNTSYLNINGVEMEFLRPNFTRGTRTITFPSGTVVKKSSTETGALVLTGYLIDVSDQP